MVRVPDPHLAHAREHGLTRYSNGNPCIHGHIGERFTVSTTCCICSDLARAKAIAVRKPKISGLTVNPHHPPPKVTRRSVLHRILADYHTSLEGRRRSAYLDNLIRK